MRKFLIAGLIVVILVGAAIAQTGVISGASVQALNASVARTLAALFADQTNAINYGADPTGSADSTSAINAALAVGKPVWLPAGHYKVTNALAVADNTGLIGAGAEATFLEITSAFNSSATGVINLTGREAAGPTVRDLTINFAQSTTQTARASFATLAASCTTGSGGTGCKYPPAIYVATANRFRILNIRVYGAWDGIIFNAASSTGGFFIDNIEMGALNKGLSVDNVLDFGHIHSYHAWAFGFSTTVFNGVYADKVTIAASFGTAAQVNGVEIDGLTSFYGRVLIDNSATWLDITNLMMDGEGSTLEVANNSWVQITNMYYTGQSGGAHCAIEVSGGSNLQIINFALYTSGQSGVCATGGTTALSQGSISPTTVDTKAIYTNPGSFAVLSVSDVNFSVNTGAGTWTVPIVDIHGTTFLWFYNNRYNGGTLAQSGLTIASDQNNTVHSNTFNGWGVSFPGITGRYDTDGWLTYSPTVAATSGTFTTASATGTYQRGGNNICVNTVITVTTVGSATAFKVSLPFAAFNSGWLPAQDGSELNGAVYTAATTTDANLRHTGATSALAPVSGHTYVVSGCYRFR